MPLQKGAKPGSKGFGKNIAAEERAGKPPAQAEAIAYSEAERGPKHSNYSTVKHTTHSRDYPHKSDK